MSFLIRGGSVVSSKGVFAADVMVENGVIAGVGCFEGYTGPVVSAAGRLIFPGFIDPHTHFDLECGDTVTADDFASGTAAAIAGGTTCIIDFANQRRGETLSYALDRWHGKADGRCWCDYGFHMSFSQWDEAVKAEAGLMPSRGVTSFKAYMTYDWRMSDGQLYDIMLRLRDFGGLLGVHCEMGGLIDASLSALRGFCRMSPDLHPVSRPPRVEAEAAERVCDIAKKAGCRVVIVHMSTQAALEAVRGRSEAIIETCPQYLLLDEAYYSLPEHEAQQYICSPPLRSELDRRALWEALADGTVSTVATDHCSFTPRQKAAGDGDFTKVPNGMPGVQTRPQLIWSEGVKTGRITAEKMCALLSENPAKIYGLWPRKGAVAEGFDADLVIWDPDRRGVLTARTQLSAAGFCPYEGLEVAGAPEKVFLRGELAAENGKTVSQCRGRFAARNEPEV